MKTLKPIIQTEEPDKYGRTVKIGITDGTTATFFQVMSHDEVNYFLEKLIADEEHHVKLLKEVSGKEKSKGVTVIIK